MEAYFSADKRKSATSAVGEPPLKKEFHHGSDTRRATAERRIVYYPTSVLSAAKIGDLLLRP